MQALDEQKAVFYSMCYIIQIQGNERSEGMARFFYGQIRFTFSEKNMESKRELVNNTSGSLKCRSNNYSTTRRTTKRLRKANRVAVAVTETGVMRLKTRGEIYIITGASALHIDQ
ncbi:2004_t:CDS:2 [Paraglomus occultum]|uniref:2004_t:CDS:1 n=1 Tax=Paraglomus occultum TaxID=144539 RepID=A0A9N9CF45_9GLOM|nr:2004_t:CDS:2 [Paraglomus occultum]